ncbi:MAG TPA: NAD(P)-binding domain-containing protein [Candidatus Binataceae bacterium]|nr:NAD(P)-binding domain-containing protein [Candidatus Binataceae bacterium]
MRLRIGLLVAGCAGLVILALLLAPRTSYEPGPLLDQHVQLSNQCAACHTPWRGTANHACITCHGDFADNNPHGDIDLSDKDSGLMTGRRLVSFKDSLSCLSCHSEHRGRFAAVKVTAAFACTYCHAHRAIDKIPRHLKPMERPTGEKHMFKGAFSHGGHLILIGTDTLQCASCHQLTRTKPGREVNFTLKRSGCAGSDCHANLQDIAMPKAAGVAPEIFGALEPAAIRHVNAVFTHSRAHLRFKCAQCHGKLAQSKDESDADARSIARCFSCHAHQPPPKHAGVTVGNRSWPGGVAMAAEPAAPRRVIACGSCHLFHTYGPGPTKDFAAPAPTLPPHQKPRFLLTAYTVELAPAHGGTPAAFTVRRVELAPWWISALAFLAVGLGGAWFVRAAPLRRRVQKARGGVAPQRAAEVPLLDDTYQSTLKQLYIVGETAGTASINFAMKSGRLVVEAIADELKHRKLELAPDEYEIAIVGCGPSGLAATATAKSSGLRYVTLEKMTPASTIRTYPRGKFVQATPIGIAEYGSFFLEGDNSKEGLIKEWEKIIASMQLVINEREDLVGVAHNGRLFELKTAKGNVYKSRYVVLAIGVRGTPRRLGLPGETPERVFYNLIEPEEFKGKNLLVVGGGNAGAEVAQALANPQLGNKVGYSFRDPALTTVTRENAEKISALEQQKALTLYPVSALKEIKPGKVVLEPVAGSAPPSGAQVSAQTLELDNDLIFAMVGAELPTRFLKSFGVRMVRKSRH